MGSMSSRAQVAVAGMKGLGHEREPASEFTATTWPWQDSDYAEDTIGSGPTGSNVVRRSGSASKYFGPLLSTLPGGKGAEASVDPAIAKTTGHFGSTKGEVMAFKKHRDCDEFVRSLIGEGWVFHDGTHYPFVSAEAIGVQLRDHYNSDGANCIGVVHSGRISRCQFEILALKEELARSREREDLLRAELEHVESLFEGDCLRRPKAKASQSPKLETPTAAAPADARPLGPCGWMLSGKMFRVHQPAVGTVILPGIYRILKDEHIAEKQSGRDSILFLTTGLPAPDLAQKRYDQVLDIANKASDAWVRVSEALEKDRPQATPQTAAPQQIRRAEKKGRKPPNLGAFGIPVILCARPVLDQVRELEPETALCLIDTDLTVEAAGQLRNFEAA
ncbi:hypothetical protein AK812_SmicGene5086 [Symbiodinium microadriaticum]|uniref:Uncharacterized protein n=1 Tax=Symbiodinium microadriaticum TaxID=2951 RepID=A0A1Q9EUK1_SYMMI|nr:hypothetical protein AK812_SmicGene5086 [Symbiodinium microadriaticum]